MTVNPYILKVAEAREKLEQQRAKEAAEQQEREAAKALHEEVCATMLAQINEAIAPLRFRQTPHGGIILENPRVPGEEHWVCTSAVMLEHLPVFISRPSFAAEAESLLALPDPPPFKTTWWPTAHAVAQVVISVIFACILKDFTVFRYVYTVTAATTVYFVARYLERRAARRRAS